LVATSSSGSFNYSWNLRNVAAGPHTLQSKAYDAAGNSAASAVVSVTR